MQCLFIGGSTEYKLSRAAFTLAGYAKALGKWVHVGRVNSDRRKRLFRKIADSIDGTSYSRFGDVYIARDLDYVDALKRQGDFEW